MLCPNAPGMAIERTASKSFRLKCSPTPNISRITPISASCEAIFTSPTTPGVYGPISTPAIKITDDRRKPEPLREQAEEQRCAERERDRRD